MTVTLSEYRRVGDTHVAAVIRQSVEMGWLPISFIGTRAPCAILMRRDHKTLAFRPDGTLYDLDEFEKDYPGQRAAFERTAAEPAGSGV